MTDSQWNNLLAVLRGEVLTPPPVGFIIDCPWLPGWMGRDIADYLSSETLWFDANRKAMEEMAQIAIHVRLQHRAHFGAQPGALLGRQGRRVLAAQLRR